MKLKEVLTPYEDLDVVHIPQIIPWQEDVAQGIITPAGDKPSQWCHPTVTVAKLRGGVRIPVDLALLVVSTQRRATFLPWMPCMGIGNYLYRNTTNTTTFITPYGCFRFCRGPLGFVATGDEYCRCGGIALAGVQQCVKVVEDILLWDEYYAFHLKRVQDVLRCRAHGITINAEKLALAGPEVLFCWDRLSRNEITAEEKKVHVIFEFPKPANLTDLQSFMGLVN